MSWAAGGSQLGIGPIEIMYGLKGVAFTSSLHFADACRIGSIQQPLPLTLMPPRHLSVVSFVSHDTS